MAQPDIDVSDNAGAHRFEARDADGTVVGFSAYRRDGDVVVITHTEVDDSQEGRGVGSVLVRGALDDIRAAGRTVQPLCPFVKAWIDRHEEYADLVSD